MLILTWGLAAAWAGPAAASGPPADTLRGRVTTAAGTAVSGVEVVLLELDRRAQSGQKGAFLIAGLPSGILTVVLRGPGYAPVVRRETVTGTTALDIVLREAAFQLEPVVVTGAREPVEPAAWVLPTAILSEDRVRREQSVSLAHTLEEVAGARTLSTGGEIGKPVIRGLAGSRVLVAEDGARLEDYSWSNAAGRLDWSTVSGDLGTVMEPIPGLAFSANLGRAWRAPTLFELFAAGPRIGEARYEIGSPDLQRETSFNLDLGAHWERGRARASLAGYRNQIADYVYLVPTGEFRVFGADSLRVYRQRQADAVLQGLEHGDQDRVRYIPLTMADPPTTCQTVGVSPSSGQAARKANTGVKLE